MTGAPWDDPTADPLADMQRAGENTDQPQATFIVPAWLYDLAEQAGHDLTGYERHRHE